MTNAGISKNKIPLFQRLAEFLFIIYLVTLYIFVDRDETLVYSNIAFLLFAGCTVLALLNRKRIYIGKNMMTVYLVFTWMYTTTFWASNSYLAGERMKTMWLLFLLLFLTYNLFYEKEDAHAYLLKGLYTAGIALIIYSLKIYGVSGAIEMMSGESGIRLGTEINQENIFGMMNATTIVIAFYYLLYKKTHKLFHILVISGAFLFAMSSGSRKALLMMCIGVLFLIYKRYGIKKLYKVILVGAVVTILFMAIIKLPMFDLIRGRMETTMGSFTGETTGDSSQRLRSKMIDIGWKLFKERMFIGYGANNFSFVSGLWTYSHNNFIEMLVNFGIIGFILYYSVYLIGIKSLWKQQNDASQTLLIILLVRTIMEIAFITYYSKEQWIILAFSMIGCGAMKKPNKNTEEKVLPTMNIVGEIQSKNEGDFCGCEDIREKNEEGDCTTKTCDMVSSEQEVYGTLDCGQGLSEIEVPCHNEEIAES